MCGKADVTAFFANYNKEACIVYDWSEGATEFKIEIGLGLGAGVGMKLPGFGAGAELTLGQKVKMSVKRKGKLSVNEVQSLCSGDSAEGKSFRNAMLKEIKTKLMQLDDSALKDAGLKKEDVQKWDDLPAFELIMKDEDAKAKFNAILEKGRKVEPRNVL